MPEADARRTRIFHADVPQKTEGFFLKGSNSLDWGLKNRLSKIFDPTSGRTVMLAVDHGYFQGPTTGLERIDLDIVPLLPYADTLMCTRGILRSVIPPTYGKGIVIRASGGPSILKELSNEELAISIEEAVRLNVAAMAVQVFIGGEDETKSIAQPDAPRRHGEHRRHRDPRRHRRRSRAGARRQVPAARHAHLRGTRRHLREDLLLRRRFRDRHRRSARSRS